MKAGIKSTEFWLTAVAHLVNALIVTDVLPTDSVWSKVAFVAATTLGSLGYNAGRAKVKAASQG